MDNITTMRLLEDTFEAYMDETHGEVMLLGVGYPAGNLLRKADPIAFRCGVLDYADAQGIDTDELQD